MLAPRPESYLPGVIKTARLRGLLLLGAGAAGIQDASAQTFTCASATDPDAVALRDYAVRLTGGDPSLARKGRAYQLPVTPPSQIQVVTTKSVCRRAAQAYHKAVRGAGAPQISRTVVVVKVGATRYLVLDPAQRAGEFETTVIFDSSFTPLLGFDS